MQGYKRFIYFGIIIIAVGITLSTNMSDELGNLGTVLIAIGGLFFIGGMHRKSEERKAHKDD